MNKKRPGERGKGRTDRKPGQHRGPQPGRPRATPAAAPTFRIVERSANRPAPSAASDSEPAQSGPFRVLIAIHRPRYRGRAERAAARVGWEVVSLLNKQDPVGLVAKPPRPPDLLVLSGDFGRQRDYAIFRAVQGGRRRGMRLIGLVDDCETAPEGHPDSAPNALCDVCLPPPYKTADLRALFVRLYEEMRGEPAPPSRHVPDDTLEPEEESERP